MINTKQEYDEQVDKLLALSVAYYDNDKRFSPASPLRKGWEDVKKAQQLGVQVITETEFAGMI